MDAQGRGRADDVDPADQWVRNPQTGEYELRLPDSDSAPRPPQTPRAPGTASRRRPAAPPPGVPAPRTAPAPDGPGVPPPRRRRDGPGGAPPGRRGHRPEKKGSRGRRILLWTGGSTAFLVLAAGTGGYLYLKHLEGNVATADVGDAGSSSFRKDEAFNILVIGTDKRTGTGNEGYGDAGSVGHADTNILLHVAEDRSNATAMSIPRDLIVDIPDCPTKLADGTEQVVPGQQGVRFNRSLGESGRDPGCTMRTVEAVTGIKPDHFMMADFNAVKTLTTAVDGVEVCVAHAIDDKESKLHLDAGRTKVEGEQALAFVRTRHSFGNKGDLDRIGVQQQFLGSLMRKMSSGDTLTDPAKLLKLADAATKALTVDSAIGKVGTLKDVALELKKVPTKNISFTTVPVLDNPAEKVPVTVVVNEAEAPALFGLIRDDVSLTEVEQQRKRDKKEEKAAVAARLKGTKADASEVRVRVLNGGAAGGAAQQELNWLQTEAGVTKSENGGNAGTELSKTQLAYDPDQADQARRLADLLGLSGSAMKPGESVTNAQGLPTMTLTLGKDFKGAGVKLNASSAATKVKDKTTADQVTCAS
ncbi:LCP family protein [Streptomyces griseoviridis]|uniref:LCP family protein required for cell wall assembly n=1 Tax=Streptomyces griseoviridis TaxID=45398 RepID=A0ABT9LEP2_STRGD|nr:LCP family protein [Streptomyces griseoviridis]MDP9682182.1 LCP family protein required for cell wall assembly [Streptomyces griseoviridis]GGS83378.1 LytR family transcriptional regulator [Streptomyces griseoviridis]